ncbi:hypothetical protein Pfo_025271 [Paulownia fortunei]|nr:hypothetical protein Pfo_025271 [Paulownia fortunei]
MDFLQTFLRHAVTPTRTFKPKVQESKHCFVYRDELDKKTAPVKIKKKVHFESKALLQRDKSKDCSETGNDKDGIFRGPAVNREKSGIQVKILMTKEEAARLLSKCKDGGILEFKDVSSELVRIPNNRVDPFVEWKGKVKFTNSPSTPKNGPVRTKAIDHAHGYWQNIVLFLIEKLSFHEWDGIEPRKPGVRKFVYRNELNLKQSSLKVKNRVDFESTPLLQNDEMENHNFSGCNEKEEKGGGKLKKVKILMRKEAAARLLSKCKDGGILEFKDVAQDLRRIPSNAVRLLSFNAKDE